MAEKKKVVEIDTTQAQEQVNNLKDSISQLNTGTETTGKTVKDLRQELKLLKDTMLQAGEGTEEYNEALTKAAEITHTLKDQTEFINATAMDFGLVISNVSGLLGGMIGGLQAAKATMNLFGIENEAVLESLQKMQNLMAITQALPAIDNGVKSFKKLSIAIKAATGATHGFKAALVSTGLGALVVALGVLIANWDKVTAAMERWGIVHKDTTKKLEEEKKKVEDLQGKLDKARQAYEDWEMSTKASKLNSEAKKQYDELTNMVKGYTLKIAEFQAEMDLVKDDKKAWDALRELAAEYEKLRDEANAARKAILENKEATQEAEEVIKKKAETVEKASNELKKLAEAYAKLTDEISQYNKSQKDINLEKLQKEEAERIKLINQAEKNSVIREQKITAVREHYALERLKIEKKYADEEVQTQQNKLFTELTLLETNYQLQIAMLQANLDDQEIDLFQFNQRKKELDEAYKEDYISTLQSILEDETLNTEQRLKLYEKLNEIRENGVNKTDSKKDGKEKSLTDGITDAINASALALNDFSNNPAWGNILKNIATLTANWETLHLNIKEGGTKAFTAYANIAATALSAVAQMLNGLALEQDASNKEGFESQKNLQAAGATMSMLAGIVSAWASSMQLGPIAGPILGSLLSAMMLATGVANIAKIKSQQFESTSNTSSVATPTSSAVSSLNIPVQYTQDVQGANIEGAIKDQRVYVTEGDISSTQNRVEVTEGEARY